jgi:hypothetical protein
MATLQRVLRSALESGDLLQVKKLLPRFPEVFIQYLERKFPYEFLKIYLDSPNFKRLGEKKENIFLSFSLLRGQEESLCLVHDFLFAFRGTVSSDWSDEVISSWLMYRFSDPFFRDLSTANGISFVRSLFAVLGGEASTEERTEVSDFFERPLQMVAKYNVAGFENFNKTTPKEESHHDILRFRGGQQEFERLLESHTEREEEATGFPTDTIFVPIDTIFVMAQYPNCLEKYKNRLSLRDENSGDAILDLFDTVDGLDNIRKAISLFPEIFPSKEGLVEQFGAIEL